MRSDADSDGNDDENSLNNTNSILIYPNPSFNYVNITIPFGSTNFNNSTIKVLDSFGKIVKYQNIINEKNNFDISDLIQGVYFVIVSDEKNIFTKKFIKQ